jgi:hypothetical protein
MVVSKITKLWRRWWNARPRLSTSAPLNELAGAPLRQRIKTYSAESGYVYQHVYRGYRNRDSAREFVFSVSAQPGRWDPLTVQLSDAVITEWQHRNSRVLTSTQKYAVAKMAMFHLLDETAGTPGHFEISLDLSAVEKYLEYLQIA